MFIFTKEGVLLSLDFTNIIKDLKNKSILYLVFASEYRYYTLPLLLILISTAITKYIDRNTRRTNRGQNINSGVNGINEARVQELNALMDEISRLNNLQTLMVEQSNVSSGDNINNLNINNNISDGISGNNNVRINNQINQEVNQLLNNMNLS